MSLLNRALAILPDPATLSDPSLPLSISPAPLVDAYAAINFLGIGLLVILIATIVLTPSSRLRRDPTLINAFIVLTLVGVCNTLYYIACGGDISTYEYDFIPHRTLCIAQAALLAGSQAAQVATVFALCMRLWLKTIQLTVPWFQRFQGRITLGGLLALPYLCILSFIGPVVKNSSSRELIPTPFYCSSVDLHLRRVYQTVSLVFAVITFVIEMHLVYLVAHHFRQTTRASALVSGNISTNLGVTVSTGPDNTIMIFFYLRVASFILWTLLMIGATLYQVFDRTVTDPNSDLCFACVAPLAFVCFASQHDVLRAWHVPTSALEWKACLGRRKRRSAGPVGRTMSTDEAVERLGWEQFLGTTAPEGVTTQLHSGSSGSATRCGDLEAGGDSKAPLPKMEVWNEHDSGPGRAMRMTELDEPRAGQLVVKLV